MVQVTGPFKTQQACQMYKDQTEAEIRPVVKGLEVSPCFEKVGV